MAQKGTSRNVVLPSVLSPGAEGDGGDISDEYSDDDDAGYRIVLVEDVGELYPDRAYRSKLSRSGQKAGKSATKETKEAASTSLLAGDAAEKSDTKEGGGDANKQGGADEASSKGEAGDVLDEKGGDTKVSEGVKKQDGEADAVDEAELAAHHMPDLIEGVQPMFKPEAAEGGATAKTDAEKETEVAAAAAVAPAQEAAAADGSSKQSTTAAASTAPGANPAVAKPTLSGAQKGGKEDGDDTVYYDCFDLKIVYERNRTGFEETKDFPIEINGVIAGRYQILEFLGAAAFSKAIQCVDLTDGSYVCIKIIKNNKDFFDQSLDEIKILKYINAHDTRDENHVLQLYDYFYFKEHLFIVTELLRDNLYEFAKFNRESGAECYFTLPRLQKITRECLEGLKFVHNLGLIHCDLKPENILIRSYSRCEIKIIDFGSSCFVTDHLTSYVQSRSYRAPEVILGLSYNHQMDMWSLGCILAELWTGRVLFQNDSLTTLLSRVVGILGDIDPEMMNSGRYTHRFFTKSKILYDRLADGERSLVYIFPKKTTLKHRLGTDDELFVDFVEQLLKIDPAKRASAEKALQHPWLSKKY